MANLIIKSSANDLVIQGSDESPAITVGTTGTTTFAENATMAGTGNSIASLAHTYGLEEEEDGILPEAVYSFTLEESLNAIVTLLP